MFKFKLQLFLQKSFFRLIMLAALAMFIGVFFFAVHLEKGNKPPAEMRLPAEADFGKPVVKGAGVDANNPLAIQHMGSREVGVMLNDIIAEALTFDQSNYKSVTANARKYFTPEGYTQYIQFLTNSGFEAALAAQNLQSGAYVEGVPVELARGVYSGAFKWVFETPVTISLIPRNAETYRNAETTAQNRNFMLRAQMARVNDPQDPNAVKIELWQVLPPRPKK